MDNSKNYIDNPLLFFLCDKVDVMKEDDIILICKQFYNEDEIVDAKKLLFDVYNMNDELKTRKGNNKTVNDLHDMTNVFRTKIKPEELNFCVTSSRRLPPVGLDHIDVSVLMKQIQDIRFDVIKMKYIHDEVNELRNDVNQLKTRGSKINDTEITSPKYHIETPVRVSSIVKKFNETNNNNSNNTSIPMANEDNMTPSRPIPSIIIDKSPSDNDYAHNDVSELATDMGNKEDKSTLDSVRTSPMANESKEASENNVNEEGITTIISSIRTSSGEWTKVTRRNRHGRSSGNGNVKCQLKEASAPPGRKWSIFLSRASPNEFIDNLQKHMLSICGKSSTVNIEKLISRHDSYSSFKIILNNVPFRINVLDRIYWSEGLYVRKFYNNNNNNNNGS